MITKDVIIINREDRTQRFIQRSTIKLITTDTYDLTPYNEIIISNYSDFYKTVSEIMQPGFLLAHGPSDDDWKLLQKYSSPDNQFEIATVIGQDKSGAWLVYGNKIGRKLVADNQPKIHGIQRGDELLLRKFPTVKNYVIVHNINQAQLIYQKQKYGPQYTK